MMEIMVSEVQKSTLKELTKKFVQESISKQIQKECGKIFPL
jgi:ribosomal protein S3AE